MVRLCHTLIVFEYLPPWQTWVPQVFISFALMTCCLSIRPFLNCLVYCCSAALTASSVTFMYLMAIWIELSNLRCNHDEMSPVNRLSAVKISWDHLAQTNTTKLMMNWSVTGFKVLLGSQHIKSGWNYLQESAKTCEGQRFVHQFISSTQSKCPETTFVVDPHDDVAVLSIGKACLKRDSKAFQSLQRRGQVECQDGRFKAFDGKRRTYDLPSTLTEPLAKDDSAKICTSIKRLRHARLLIS